MSKYIDAEKLLSAIERLTNQKIEKLKRFSDEDYTCSVASSINCKLWGNAEVLFIIKSLQQEQPDVDLEKEIEKYFKGWTETDEGIACHYQYVDLNTCRSIARHFYELGKLNARKEVNK